MFFGGRKKIEMFSEKDREVFEKRSKCFLENIKKFFGNEPSA